MRFLLPLLLLLLPATPAVPDDRLGAGDEFNTLDGWTVTRESFASMRVEQGVAVFETHILNLPAKMNGKEVSSRTFLDLFKPGTPLVKYGEPLVGYKAGVAKDLGVIDLDRFHYVVMKIDERPMGAELELSLEDQNGRKSSVPLQVACSSGILSQDLAPLGVKGKQKVRLNLEIFCTGRELRVDYVRFVSSLADEEKAGLIPAPVTLPAEHIATHPYQKLEALWQRSPRPWANLPASAEEQALYRDVGTGMPTWRLTATPAHEGLKGANLGWVWRADGSSVSTPARTFHFDDGRWANKESQRYWEDKAAEAVPYKIERNKATKTWTFSRKDEKGQWQVITEHKEPEGLEIARVDTAIDLSDPDGSSGSRRGGNRLALALLGAEVFIVDVEAATGKFTTKTWPLPPIDAKGIALNGKTLSYWCPFLSMHRILVDLDTGKITDGVHHTMTHGMSGADYSIMSYDGVSKVVLSPEARQTSTPGRGITVYGPYKDLVETDYGEMTFDSRYGVTNGLRGELANEYCLFDRLDPGTVLRLATYNVSYETWDLRAKEDLSPDYTKIAYASDFLGDADIYYTVVRTPTAPKDVKAAREANGVKVTWTLPEPRREIKGYDVYRSNASGKGFAKLTKSPVAAAEFLDANAPAGPLFYLVTSVEHSGLVSVFSNEAAVDAGNAKVILHYEAEDARKGHPGMREVVDGFASGYRVERLTPVREGEGSADFQIRVDVPRAGDYTVWLRGRGTGTVAFWVGDDKRTAARFESDKLTWVKARNDIPFVPVSHIMFYVEDPGVAIDKIIVTDDKDYVPKSADDRKSPPAAPANLRVTKTTANSVELAWDPVAEADLYCYSVYVSDKPDFVPGNETVLCSLKKTAACDWGIKPRTSWFYKVVAIDAFGNESAPASVEAKTERLESFATKLVPAAPEGSKFVNGKDPSGVQYVEYPGADAGEQSLKLDFDVPAAGACWLWVQYTPTWSKRAEYDNFGFQLDSAKLRTFGTRPEPPREQKGPGRWFFERLASDEKLVPGKHALTLVFKSKDGVRSTMGQRVAAAWVTNDAWFVPPGYTAQVMFKKPTEWARK